MDDTFVLDDAPAPTLSPPSDASQLTLGGLTVLPRVEVRGDVPELVSTERPRFEPLGKLGEGGLGEVLSARDLDIGRRVAIKRIRPDRASRGAFLRFVQEVRTTGRLDHPGIVPVHDVAKDSGGEYFFVMKQVEGQTLTEIIDALKAGDAEAHARFPFEKRLAIVEQLMHAVAFAHAQGVIHRDLKPDNVMVGEHGEVTLIDWGIAKQIGGPDIQADSDGQEVSTSLSVTRTRVGQVIGTPRYMAPEQARGEPADVRTDTFALSLILYELLALHHPLDDVPTDALEPFLEAVKTRTYGNPAFAPIHPAQGRMPPDLGWFVNDGVKSDPDARYQTVEAMLERLKRRAEGDIGVQCPVTFQLKVVYRLRKMVQQHPFRLVWMSLLLSALLLGLGVLAGLMAGGAFGGLLAALLV